MRWLVLGAAGGLAASACSLDMSGLGDVPWEDDGGLSSAMGEDSSVVEELAPQGSGQDATGSSSLDGPITSDSTPSGEASIGDVGVKDAPAEAGEAGSACDQDGDGYKATTGGCGGTDCCDTDAHVHPGQTSYFTSASACGSFDYDCDGKDTPEYGTASCSWNSFSCNGDGFAPPLPGCGDFGTFTSCSMPWYDVFSCTGSNGSQAQACR